jgi:hypothetical protein
MVKRKGAGYIIEVMTAVLIMFGFIIGNAPADPATDWSSFQKEVSAEDITYTLEKTGDTNSFIREGEKGSLVTAADTLSRDRLALSGTVENVPISTQVAGFHTREIDRENASLNTENNLDDNRCYQDDDLEELESEYDILRTEEPKAGAYLYITDTDPQISGGTNGEEDYDTIWVDNGTRCQFSSSEGPYYIDEFFYWGDGPGGDYWDSNEIYGDEKIEVFNATQVVRLQSEIESRVNGIDTGVVVDSMAAEREDLSSYDILVFRESQTLTNGVLDERPGKIQKFMSDGSVLLMMDLEKDDFYNGDTPADNFLTNTGLKWVDLPYRNSYRENPDDSIGGSYGDNSIAEQVETYFKGTEGDIGKLNLTPGGNITSSNSENFKTSEPILSTDRGSYQVTEWNVTNSSMEPVDPSNVDGYPSTACVEEGKTDGNLTMGTFEFENYQTDDTVEYEVINTKLGEDKDFCQKNDVRALNINFNRNDNFGDPGEGPYLNGESMTVKNKRYTVYFPGDLAIEYGNRSMFIYTGKSNIENINYRTSFEGFPGQKLARIEYKEKYNQNEKRMISALIHWLSDDTTQFGEDGDSRISTESIGGVKEETFMPYRISMRWR